jgi:hypothetical protein
MSKLKRYFWNLYYQFYYRKVEPDVCCCGTRDCGGDYTHGYVNAKDYAIDEAVNSKFKPHNNT